MLFFFNHNFTFKTFSRWHKPKSPTFTQKGVSFIIILFSWTFLAFAIKIIHSLEQLSPLRFAICLTNIWNSYLFSLINFSNTHYILCLLFIDNYCVGLTIMIKKVRRKIDPCSNPLLEVVWNSKLILQKNELNFDKILEIFKVDFFIELNEQNECVIENLFDNIFRESV